MRNTHARRIKILIVAALSLLAALDVSRRSTRAQNGEGDAWMGMNSDTRTGFVWGYMAGLSTGYGEGCDAYHKFAPPTKPHLIKDDPFHKCIASSFGFSQPVSFYVKQITDFYSLSASVRQVPFGEVLKKLSDSESMTPRQMHEWFREHGHRK